MVSSLRLACLCLSTSRLYSFQAITVATSSPLARTAVSIFYPAGSSRAFKRATRHMTTSPSYNVGQADIGNDNQDEADSYSSEIKSWRYLLETSITKSRKIRGSNYVQLATVDPASNEPRCRSVVFRGFLKLSEGHSCLVKCDDLPCVMKMCTDRRSEKVDQVMAHPTKAAELLWWFPKSSEQYRIRGALLFVGGGEFDRDNDRDLAIARKELWGNLSDAARESFLSQDKPGAAYARDSSVPTGGRDEDGNLLPPPDAFLLMLLIPKHCDYLRLTNVYRQDDELVAGEWESQRVNP
jgi:pyridoxamine 5'-phosphate oxidase